MNKTIDYGQAALLQLKTGQDYDDYGFDDAYFDQIVSLMSIDPDTLDWEAFLSDHFNLLYTFLQLPRFDENWFSIEDENKAIQKAQDHIASLIPTLNTLDSIDSIKTRIFEEFLEGNGSAFELDGMRLSSLAGPENGLVLENIVSLLRDLLLALEHSKIRRFNTEPEIESTLKIRLSANSPEEFLKRDVASTALASQGEDAKSRYKRLSQEFGKPRELALLGFLQEFAFLWQKYSILPFTEGRYEPDAKQTISRTVDAAQFCLTKMNANYDYKVIANSVRTIRESLQ